MSPYLARIDLFPIKSLDGRSVQRATVLASGALQGDRTYAILDAHQRVINAKRTAAIHPLRAQFSPDGAVITCTVAGQAPSPPCRLPDDQETLATWLGDYFQQPVTLAENREMGFPDDTQAAGPTVISTATLAAVASWYPGLTVDQVRRRLRTNLEIDGVPAFWEDQLFSAEGDPVLFALGDVVLEGVNPCQRCIVPTRNAATGEVLPQFQATFAAQRRATLPPWAPANRFNHFYRLAINTNIRHQGGQDLRVGDPVRRLASSDTATP